MQIRLMLTKFKKSYTVDFFPFIYTLRVSNGE